MSAKPKYRTCMIIFILLISSLSVLMISPVNVTAQETTGETTLYFSKYNFSDSMDQLYPEMSMTHPTGENASHFPPKIENTDEWLEWITIWFYYKLGFSQDIFDGLTEEELEELGLTEEDLLEFFDLLDPFSFQQVYVYDGVEELNIKGNVKFELFFTSTLISKLNYKDEVEVGLYLNEKEQKKTKITIEPEFLKGNTQKQSVFLESLDFTLEKGDQVSFLVKIIPAEKPIYNLIESRDLDQILDVTDAIADTLANQSFSTQLQELGIAMQDFLNITEDESFNFTMEDLAQIVNTGRSSKLVYGSADFPSSVTLPVKISDDENIRTYYLRENFQLIESKSINEEATEASLKEPKKWNGPGLERNKMVMDATATLYLKNRNLRRLFNRGNTNVIATLTYDNTEIATSSVELGKTTIIDPLINPIEPTIFDFTFTPIEIDYGSQIGLQIEVENGTKFGPFNLGIYRNVDLLYDSDQYPSHITVNYNETDNIKIDISDNVKKEVYVGGSTYFDITIFSELDDEITLTPKLLDIEGDWAIDINDKFDLDAGESITHRVYINHTNLDLDAYGDEDEEPDYVIIEFEASGKTGLDSEDSSVEVSKDAIDYEVLIHAPDNIKVKHGKTATYTFKVTNKNTGLWPDSYEIVFSSENNWTVVEKFLYEDLSDVDAGETINITVELKVPKYTDISSDKLKLIIVSEESGKEFTANVTTEVETPNIFESVYHLFEEAAKAMGLYDALGKYGTWLLITLTLIILLLFLIPVIIVIRRKDAVLICTDRVKEISSDQKAVYSIKIKNPTKQKLDYKLSVDVNSKAERWDVSLSTDEISIDSKQSQIVQLTVKPTDMVKEADWVEAVVKAKVKDRNKESQITTVTTLKNAKPNLKIMGVIHWPKNFKKGQKVETSFKIENKGKVAASNVTVVLYVNGEEKNKVEDITIPRGGYAEIDMPWIAVKGKNEVNIVVY